MSARASAWALIRYLRDGCRICRREATFDSLFADS
jgi:hypothetical protein